MRIFNTLSHSPHFISLFVNPQVDVPRGCRHILSLQYWLNFLYMYNHIDVHAWCCCC